MIEISQKEFITKIQELLTGRTSRIKLAEELQTDIRTLNNKIVKELSINAPDLYIEFIKKYPYKQKERDDIDYEALVIEMLKTGMYTEDAAQKYNLGVRTIQRKVNKLEKENPYLIGMYREMKELNKHGSKVPLQLEESISKLVQRPVKISEPNATRIKQLEETECIFNNRCNFLTKEEAAKSMGMTINTVYKMLNELYSIKIATNYSNMEDDFKKALKANVSQEIRTNNNDEPKQTKLEIPKEGEEK